MKKLLIGLLALASVSAFASAFDMSSNSDRNVSLLPGNYAPNSKTCGFHVEISGDVVVLSTINNFKVSRTHCVENTDIIFKINKNGRILGDKSLQPDLCSSLEIIPMSDGNFIIINPCRSTTMKFYR